MINLWNSQRIVLILLLLWLMGGVAPRVAVAYAEEEEGGAAMSGQTWDLPVAYLTWQRDPTTTMTVHWLSEADQPGGSVQYRLPGEAAWREVEGSTTELFEIDDRVVHEVELTGLSPDTTYEFRYGSDAKVYRFRTMPASLDDRPIRFADGGDIKDHELCGQLSRQIAARDADFLILGGDIAYASGKPELFNRWISLFDTWRRTLVTEEGRLIPLVPTIGNHEVSNGGFGRPVEDAPYFYALFKFPTAEQPYDVLDFGDYLSLFLLNSGHTAAVDGEQTQWLRNELAKRTDQMHRIAVYHTPAFPSSRKIGSGSARMLRKHWVPLFDEFKLHAAFEHHDHYFKRTYPIRDNQIDPYGTVYFGDGSFGQSRTRAPDPSNRWYLATSGPISHVWFVTLDGPTRHIEAINLNGEVFDSYSATNGVPAPVIKYGPSTSMTEYLLNGLLYGWPVIVILLILKAIRDHKRKRAQPAVA